MIVVTGLGVSSLILSNSGWPHPGFLVSTTTTPVAVTKTAEFPPPPLSTNRLSFSCSTWTTRGAGCCPPAGGHDGNRARVHELLAGCLIARTQRQQCRRDNDHDRQLPDFHTDVEGEQRPRQRPAGQLHF